MDFLHLFSILLLSVSSNLDNYGVGFAYGLRNVCIQFKTNTFIAFVNAMGTLISMLIGERIYNFFRPETAGIMGSLLFVLAGCWLIMKDISKRLQGNRPNPDGPYVSVAPSSVARMALMGKTGIYCRYCETDVSFREGILLALALTFSNLVTGVGAALVGLDIVISVCMVFISGILALALGVKTGGCAGGRWVEGHIDLIAGILLIIIGIYEFLV